MGVIVSLFQGAGCCLCLRVFLSQTACPVCAHQQCFQVFIARARGGQVDWSHPYPLLLTLAHPTWTCQDWPRTLPSTLCEGPFQHLPTQSRLLSVSSRPEQPLRALAEWELQPPLAS